MSLSRRIAATANTPAELATEATLSLCDPGTSSRPTATQPTTHKRPAAIPASRSFSKSLSSMLLGYRLRPPRFKRSFTLAANSSRAIAISGASKAADCLWYLV